jgi:hypothetical protein
MAGVAVASISGSTRAADFQLSYTAGFRDAAGGFAGGTEMRLLVAHAAGSMPEMAIEKTGPVRKGGRPRKSWCSTRPAPAGASTTCSPTVSPTAGCAIWR